MAPADVTMTKQAAGMGNEEVRRSKLSIWLARAWRFRMGLFGSFIFSLLVVMAVFAPWIATHDPYEQDILFRLTPPVFLEGGSWELSFADMMTLILCFFVLMVTVSEVDKTQYDQVADSLGMTKAISTPLKVECNFLILSSIIKHMCMCNILSYMYFFL